jgi:alanine dehydrogenase
VDDVVHYCVANMPGGVPRTSTLALNKATLPLLVKIADQGYEKTLKENKNYLEGLNVFKGAVTCKGVAEAFKLKYTPNDKVL